MRVAATCLAFGSAVLVTSSAHASPNSSPDPAGLLLVGLPGLLAAAGGVTTGIALGATYDDTPDWVVTTGLVFGALNGASAGVYATMAGLARPMNYRTDYGLALFSINIAVAAFDFALAGSTEPETKHAARVAW